MPVGNYSYQFLICCPRDCVSRYNGGTSGPPLKPLRVDSALRTLLTLRGLRGALGQQMLNATVGINGLTTCQHSSESYNASNRPVHSSVTLGWRSVQRAPGDIEFYCGLSINEQLVVCAVCEGTFHADSLFWY